MEIRILGSYGGDTKFSNLTSFTINDTIALDAGCLTNVLSLKEQVKITDVLISHSHMDHITSLPFLIDNLFGETPDPLHVWASEFVISCLKKHIFNDIIWPDFTSISFHDQPSLVFHPLVPNQRIRIGDLEITPVPVNHIVPTFGYYIEDSDHGFLFSSDTTSTSEIWEYMNTREKLKTMIVDCSFPNHMRKLAVKSGHMTPELLIQDLKQLKRTCQIYVYHAKPSYREQIQEELKDTGLICPLPDIQGHTLTV